jgi:hypothetical protein
MQMSVMLLLQFVCGLQLAFLDNNMVHSQANDKGTSWKACALIVGLTILP